MTHVGYDNGAKRYCSECAKYHPLENARPGIRCPVCNNKLRRRPRHAMRPDHLEKQKMKAREARKGY